MSLSLDLESIILLLLFIAPGFLFTRTYTAYRPRYYREPTAFEQFVLAIVGSTAIHTFLLSLIAITALSYWGLTGQLLYFNNFFTPGVSLINYPLPVLSTFLFTAAMYLFLSLILSRRFATFLGRHGPADRPRWWRFILGEDPPEPFLLWHTILQIEALRLDLIPPHLAIQMRSGEYFEGDLYQMRLAGDEENTVELALRNVYRRVATPLPEGKTGISSELQALDNQILLLKSSDILWLTRDTIPQ
jgi:hypothetical protein